MKACSHDSKYAGTVLPRNGESQYGNCENQFIRHNRLLHKSRQKIQPSSNVLLTPTSLVWSNNDHSPSPEHPKLYKLTFIWEVQTSPFTYKKHQIELLNQEPATEFNKMAVLKTTLPPKAQSCPSQFVIHGLSSCNLEKTCIWASANASEIEIPLHFWIHMCYQVGLGSFKNKDLQPWRSNLKHY